MWKAGPSSLAVLQEGAMKVKDVLVVKDVLAIFAVTNAGRETHQ